jgi:hypothetical protein
VEKARNNNKGAAMTVSSYQLSAISQLLTAFSYSTKIPRPKYQDRRAKVKKQNTTQNATPFHRFALQPCVSCPVAFRPAPFSVPESGFCFPGIAAPPARNDNKGAAMTVSSYQLSAFSLQPLANC